jgi:hypothetical protein
MKSTDCIYPMRAFKFGAEWAERRRRGFPVHRFGDGAISALENALFGDSGKEIDFAGGTLTGITCNCAVGARHQ